MNWSEHGFECEQGQDAAAYVLGALDERETLAYQEHLEACAVCRQEVAQLAPVAEQLSIAVEHLRAPRELGERIMATVTSEAEVLHAAGSQADRPVRFGWRVRPLLGALAAAGATAIGVLVGALLIGEGSSTVHVFPATVTANAHSASAQLREVDNHSELEVSKMPAPPLGRIYEVWLQHSNGAVQPTDALFSVTHTGSGSVAIPSALHGIKAVMVTDEPLGGSRVPTRSPVIVVRLS